MQQQIPRNFDKVTVFAIKNIKKRTNEYKQPYARQYVQEEILYDNYNEYYVPTTQSQTPFQANDLIYTVHTAIKSYMHKLSFCIWDREGEAYTCVKLKLNKKLRKRYLHF